MKARLGEPDAGTPDATDALTLVALAHDALRGRLAALDASDAGGRTSIVQACLALKIQSRLEDEVVLPVLRASLGEQSRFRAALADCAEAEGSIERLLALPPGAPGTPACFQALRQSLERAYADVEVALFAALGNPGMDVEELGHRLAQRRLDILGELGVH